MAAAGTRAGAGEIAVAGAPTTLPLPADRPAAPRPAQRSGGRSLVSAVRIRLGTGQDLTSRVAVESDGLVEGPLAGPKAAYLVSRPDPRRVAPSPQGRRLARRVLLVIGACVPPALVVVAIALYGVNVPFWDQLELPVLLQKLHRGELRLEDLWAQHNEHRIFFPRLVWLSLAAGSGWNVLYELYANVVVAALTFMVLRSLLRTTVDRIDPEVGRWLLIPTSLLVFSWAQWENWTWGWQIQIFMNTLGTVVAIWAVARWPRQWPGLVVAYGATLFAALSFTPGLLLLGIIPLAIVLGGGQRTRAFLTSALAASALIAWLYLSGYQKPQQHPDLLYFAKHPTEYLGYVLAYLGLAVGAANAPVAMALGLLGLASLCWSTYWVWRHRPAARAVVVPWALLATYAVLGAGVTGLGRAGFGVEQALSGRYTTLSTLLWIGVLVTGAVAFRLYWAGLRPAGLRGIGIGCLAASLTAVVAGGYGVSYARGNTELKMRRAKLLSLEECLSYYQEAPNACLEQLYPSAPIVRERAAILQSLGLGPFASGNRPAPLSSYEIAPARDGIEWGRVELVRAVDGDDARVSRRDRVRVAGWTLDPTAKDPPRAVLVVVNGTVMGTAKVKARRLDLTAVFRPPAVVRSGWSYRFGAFRLHPGRHLVEAYALSQGGHRLAKLTGEHVIEVTD